MENEENQKGRRSGGNGGKIFIFAKEIRGNGKILADGGSGFVGGKGGEIHIVSEKNNFTGEVSAKGGKFNIIAKKDKGPDWGKLQVIIAVIAIVVSVALAIYF